MTYSSGTAEALTLTEAASQIAYCYECKDCPFKERVNLTRIAADYPVATQIGDLRNLLPCGECGSKNKVVMTLWLNATTTERMLRERGYPVWEDD